MKHVDLEGFEAEFLRVALPFGLVVDTIHISASETHVGLKPLSMSTSKPGRVTVRISTASVAAFLESKTPGGLKNFKVETIDDRLHVQATVKLVVKVEAKAVCRLNIIDGKLVNVELESVDVLGGPAKKLVEGQISKVNPILDAGDFPFNVTLTELHCADGYVTGTGTITP